MLDAISKRHAFETVQRVEDGAADWPFALESTDEMVVVPALAGAMPSTLPGDLAFRYGQRMAVEINSPPTSATVIIIAARLFGGVGGFASMSVGEPSRADGGASSVGAA